VPTSRPLSRRRLATRQRLLDAALAVFAESGFGRTTVEQVCERAGFTRGAFYSNFTSLDELFIAAWEQKSAELLDRMRAAVAEHLGPAETLEAGLDLLLAAVPIDEEWYRISAEFTAHALRHPPLRRVMAAREAGIAATLLPIYEELLAGQGRRIPDPTAFINALIAVHDGTLVQCLVEPDDPDVRARRRQLFLTVVEAYTEPTDTAGEHP